MSFNLNCIMQLKQFYNIATKVSSRKKCYYIWWSTWLLSVNSLRPTHICVGELTIIASDNGLSPGRRQAIIWTNAWILLIGPYRTHFSEILIEILTFSFTKMILKVPSAKWQPFYLGLNVLNPLVLKLELFVGTMSIACLMILWVLTWPGAQHLCSVTGH